MKNTGAIIAENLLKIKAVRLNPDNPFTWASGMKSPIYCDNRQTLSFPEIRTLICDAFCAVIRDKFPDANGVAGVATAGLPHGMLVADRLGLPFIYVRSGAKGHGLRNQIEGRMHDDAKYIVIEDLVSTGGSSLKAVEALREAGATVSGLAAIFTYGFPQSVQAFEGADVRFESLTNLPTLLEKAIEIDYIRPEYLNTIQQWQVNPQKWAPATLNT